MPCSPLSLTPTRHYCALLLSRQKHTYTLKLTNTWWWILLVVVAVEDFFRLQQYVEAISDRTWIMIIFVVIIIIIINRWCWSLFISTTLTHRHTHTHKHKIRTNTHWTFINTHYYRCRRTYVRASISLYMFTSTLVVSLFYNYANWFSINIIIIIMNNGNTLMA